MTHAYNPKGEWPYQHLMSVNGTISRVDLLAEADRYGVRHASDILADVRAALESWPSFAKDAGLSAAAADRVAVDFQAV